MFIHKNCGDEVCVRNDVTEYAPLEEITDNGFTHGDVSESSVVESCIWCEACGTEVATGDCEEK